MKRVLLAGLALLGATTVPTTVHGQGLNVAFVDSRLILRETPGYSQADSQFNREMAAWRAEMQRLQASLDSAARDFEQSSVVMSPSARDAKRQELVNQQGVLEQRAADLENQAGARQRELYDPIERKVTAAIEKVRADGGYAFIFDVGSPGNAIVAADRSLDLTQRVIATLKEGSN